MVFACTWGVDLLTLVGHVARIITGRRSGRPLPPVNDGDLLHLVQSGTVDWSRQYPGHEGQGHADEGMVALGRVREFGRIGNNEVDAAPDIGRRRVRCLITDALRLV